jgi:predicted nucleic-acid-binding protein
MTGLDTNVLVRYLVQDDVSQAKAADTVIEGAAGRGERLFLASITLCELVWVLESAYGYGRTEIVPTLEQITRTADFELEHAEYVRAALVLYRDTTADFADALVGEINLAAGCDTTITFDKGLKRLARFRVI